MQIRNTRPDEIDQVMAIYARARVFMAENGNPNQWGRTNWPPRELIIEDIKTKKSYVCVDELNAGKIIGVFYHDYGKDIDSTYDVIEEGSWSTTDQLYGVVHRIATDGTRGVGSFCVNWAFIKCGNLRIDTHPDNHVMQGMLGKLGFRKCGIIHVVEDNDPRYAYDKVRTEE